MRSVPPEAPLNPEFGDERYQRFWQRSAVPAQ